MNKSADQKSTLSSDASASKNNYQHLLRYIHCCPLTYKEFCKYSNITALVKKFCEEKSIDAAQYRLFLYRSYILFYLAPVHRKINPINKIQLLDACPAHIKEKFFSIPTQLYLKEQILATPEKLVNNNENLINNNTKQALVSASVNTNTALHSKEVASVPTAIPSAIKNNSENIYNEDQHEISPKATSNKSDSPQNKCKENNATQDQKTAAPSISKSYQHIQLPVSLENFKKYTHYEEVVETLFKIKAQDNEELFCKYKNFPEAFENTLVNYFRAFYLSPAVREIIPIRFKPVPHFLKSRLLQIPEGIEATSKSHFELEKLISPNLNTPEVGEKETETDCCARHLVEKNKLEDIKTEHKALSSSTPSIPKTFQHIEMPVSFKIFKKYTHYDEVVEQLFKIKSQDNEELFLKYKNSPEAFENTLENYFRAFYLSPAVREIIPIRLKPVPNRLKSRLLQIPEGIEVNSPGNLKVEKLVSPDLNIPVVEEKEIACARHMAVTTIRERKALNKSDISKTSTNSTATTNNKENDVVPSDSDNKLSSTSVSVKRANNDQMQQSPSPKRLKSQQTADDSNYTEKRKKSYKDLLPYEHCCPVTFSEFCKYTNISKLLSGFCQKRYNSLRKLPYMLKIAYLFYYLSPEERSFKPLNKLQILSNCPSHLKETILEIPKNLYLKGEEKNQRQIQTDAETKIKRETVKEKPLNNSKVLIEILENRLLPPLTLPLSGHTEKKSSTTNQAEGLASTTTQMQQDDAKKLPKDLFKSLNNDKIFAKFCQKLLAKLNELYDETIEFCLDTYKDFIHCNEIPLRQILNDFCEHNEVIVQRILNEKEVFEALQRYYYYKCMTNRNFALKYPVKEKVFEKTCNAGNKNELESCRKSEKTQTDTKMINENSSGANRKQQKYNTSLTQFKEISPTSNPLEKAKRIFFRNVDKTSTLSYVLCTSFGFKQLILCRILDLTFNEFVQLTNIYEGNDLYDDTNLAECMYRYVFRTPLVWPTNLFIPLRKLLELLHAKNIHFDDYSTMLTYISPKVLHWSNLLSCTNIVECVQIDFEKRTGKLLNTYDTKTLKQECVDYYNRCWKNEKWLGEIPVVYEDFYKDYVNDNNQDDVTMLDKNALQELCKEPDVAASEKTIAPKDFAKTSSLHKEISEQSVFNQNSCAPEEKVPDFVSEVNVETTEKNYSPTNPNSSIKEFSCVIMPNTQQQIEMLPNEVRVPNDPLNNSIRSLNNSPSSHASYETISLGELTQPVIKKEPNDNKLLTHLFFYEDEDSNMQCKPCEEEVFDLDSILESQVIEENLPPSQVFFEEAEPVLWDVLPNSESGSSLINLNQQMLSAAKSNDGNAGTQQFVTSTQPVQLQDVSLKSSGEDDYVLQQTNLQNLQEDDDADAGQVKNICPEKVLGKQFEILQSSSGGSSLSSQNFPEAQHFPSTFEEVAVPAISLKQQELATANEQNELNPSTSKAVQPLAASKTNQRLNLPKATLPLSRPITKTYVAVKGTKNIAKVRPLKNSGLVPQIQHNTRPLQTKPAYSNSKTKDNREPNQEIASLEPPENSSSGPNSPNSYSEYQLSPLGTHIYISQELNKNCSVFNNTSLLRKADINYQMQNTASASQKSSQQKAQTGENQQLPETCNISQQPARRVTRSTSMCQTSPTNNVSNQQQASTRIVTRSSLCKEINEKVNNLAIQHTNNLVVASIAPIIHRPHYSQPYKMVRKFYLYRQLVKFHYFKELTAQHISKYLLPSLEIGKSYTEALVVSENFKTRISNRSVSAIFSFWPQSLQRDFLLVLCDLKEFHYVAFEKASMQKQEDLRARILFWLLNTAPSFSFCQFVHETNSTEFSLCEPINNGNNPSYERKPFKCLTNAYSGKVLKKLKDMKMNLRKS